MGDIFWAVFWVIAKYQNQPFLAICFQRLYLINYLAVSQCFSDSFFVFRTKPAIRAIVDAFVPNIKGREQNNPVAINCLFQFRGSLLDFINQDSILGVD